MRAPPSPSARATGGIRAEVCRQAEPWNRFVRELPWATAQHAFEYGRVLGACFGYLDPSYRLLRADGEVVAALPLIRFNVGPFRALYSLAFDMYGGPLVQPSRLEDPELQAAIADEILQEARAHRAFETRVALSPASPKSLARGLATACDMQLEERECPLVPLDRPWSRIEAGFRPSVQRALRRAAKEGVRVEAGAAVEAVRAAYPLYARRMRHLGATAKPWRFIEALLDEGLAVGFVARTGERTIGFLVLLVAPDVAIYWQSALSPDAVRLRPMNALVECALRWCHAQGVRLFSFGESHGDRPGLVRFKLGWGAEMHHTTFAGRTHRPALRAAWHALEPAARRLYASWDRLRYGRPEA